MLGIGLALTSQSATSNAAASSVPAGAVAFTDLMSGAQAGLSKTFTRASTATYFDNAGVMQSAANDVLRLDHNRTTLAPLGVLLEVARTNSLRNSTMAGAGAGVLPNFWTGPATLNGITRAVVGAGIEDGIPYVDIQFSGTASSAVAYTLGFEANAQVVAAAGQTWFVSMYGRLVAGALTNAALSLWVSGRLADGNGAGDQGSVAVAPTSAALKTQRFAWGRALSVGTVARVLEFLYITVANGLSVDFTIRIGLPVLEQGAAVSTPIPSASAAVTRAADVLTLTPTSGAALTWRARYRDNSTSTLATGVTGAYAVDPATLTLPSVRLIWAATS